VSCQGASGAVLRDSTLQGEPVNHAGAMLMSWTAGSLAEREEAGFHKVNSLKSSSGWGEAGYRGPTSLLLNRHS
jgi:hypothetical protein